MIHDSLTRLFQYKYSRILQLATLLFTLGATAFAQVEKGVVTGLIKDPAGSAVNEAKISLHNSETDLTTVITSNDEGLFVSPPLTPGEYEVKFEAQGFRTAVRNLRLQVAQRISTNVVLELGAASETVQVDGSVQQFDTDTSTVSSLRTEEAVQDLPLNGRNFASLLGLGAGVVPGQTQMTGSIPYTQQRGPTAYNVNGQRMTDNRILLDGIADNENHNGLGVIIFPPIEAIQEFREETAAADARYGGATGGVVNLSFRSGTSQYHGTVFEFFRNNKLDAKNYFDTSKPAFRFNNFGVVLGGPLFKRGNPKTFFFVDYSGQRTAQSLTFIDTVPLWGPKGVGDFSLYTSATIKDPVTKATIASKVIPASYLTSAQSIVGQNVLKLYSDNGITPNRPGYTTSTANNFIYSPLRVDNGNAFDIKIDHSISDKDSVFGRYSHARDDIFQPGILPSPLIGANISGPAQQPGHQAVLSETHVFSPTLINTLRFGWTRMILTSQNVTNGLRLPEKLGIPGVIKAGDEKNTDGLPVFSISGATGIGDPSNSPTQIGTNNYQTTNNLTLIRGKHSIDFGFDVVRSQYNMFQTAGEHGTLAFTGNFTGLGFADLLLGAPTSGTIQYQQGTRGFRRLDIAGYVQDTYKVHEKLTLNLGVRYENFIGWPWTEVLNRMYQFDPKLSTTQVFQVGTNGVSRSGGTGNNYNFSPRIGFAYRLTNSTTLQSGFGFYRGAPNVSNSSGLSMNAPALDYWAFSNTAYAASGFNWLSNGFTHTRATTNAPQGAPLFSVDPNFTTPYSEQWHVSVRQLIGSATRITVAYVGNNGVHLDGLVNINQATPGTTAIATRRPYSYFGQIWQLQTPMKSHYNALQVTAERRTKNFNFSANYTYSHALDNNTGNASKPVNSYNIRGDYANSDANIPQRLVGNISYTLPFHTSGRLLKPIVEGWQLNSIVTLSDGIPFSVSSGSNSLGIADGITPRALLAPSATTGALPSGSRTLSKWYNTAAFDSVGTDWNVYAAGAKDLDGTTVIATGTTGRISGRNSLQGPGTKVLDFSVFKTVPLHESKALQLRAEFFNLLNTPQFNNPTATTGVGAGTISAAGSPTTLQRVSRQIQLAAKINF